MGTETHIHAFLLVLFVKLFVKLNNPQMGMETLRQGRE